MTELIVERAQRGWRANAPLRFIRIYESEHYGTWDLAARYPERWAAAVPICGGGAPGMASRLEDLPLWAFHGARDPVVPLRRTVEMVEAIRAAGGSPRYTEFPDAGHDSWTPAYTHPEFLPWLFAQRRTSLRF